MPAGWAATEFGFLIGELRNGIGTKPNMQPPGMPILRIDAVRPGRVLYDDVRYMPDADELVETYRLKNRDLLFTRACYALSSNLNSRASMIKVKAAKCIPANVDASLS